MKSAYLLLLLVVSGCAHNLEELRHSPVKHTASFMAPYDHLATCTKQRFENATTVDLKLWEDQDRGLIRLTALRPIPLFRPDATFEFIFFREVPTIPPTNSPTITLVEFRNDDRTDLQSDGKRISDEAWIAINVCSTAVSPPAVSPK
jgi:hypothetical protein